MNMKTYIFSLINILALGHLLVVLCVSERYDFFYFVQQWPGSYCVAKGGCCYPTTGKPAADFGIHGLWPTFNNGSWPDNCNRNNPYNQTKIPDLISSMEKEWPTLACPSNNGTKFWAHEWDKHGTCSESVLDQHAYFQTNLDLKKKVNLLEILKNAGINPNGKFYTEAVIRKAITDAIGFAPAVIRCNVDPSGNSQLYEIYMCVDSSGSKLIKCPLFPKSGCRLDIQFPPF